MPSIAKRHPHVARHIRRAHRIQHLSAAVLLGLSLTACSVADRLAQVGQPPPLTTIENPSVLHGNRPVQMPLPPIVEETHMANSLWRPGSRHFLKDQRASEVGDIVTVVIEIADSAEIENSTSRSRGSTEDASLGAFLGYEQFLTSFLPSTVSNANLVDVDSDSNTSGTGSVNRDESINLRVAALVTQVLPNGNLVIAGRQEVRVNFEVRDLQVAGLIRPEDITSINTVGFDQIAEARISYGGRGQITDVQQPRYGLQVYDILWPF